MTQYAKDVDFSQLTLEPVLTRYGKGGLLCKIKCGKDKLSVQAPKMKAPVGLSAFDDDAGRGKKYSIMLSFDGIEAPTALGQSLQRFKGFLENMENWLADAALAHINGGTKDWAETFGKKQYKKEIFQEGFLRPFLKPGKENKSGEQYPPSISVKLQTNVHKDTGEETFKTEFVDPAENPLKAGPLTPDELADQLPKKSFVTPVLDIEGVWIVDRKVSLSVKLSTAKIFPSDAFSGCKLLPEEDMPDEVPAYLDPPVDDSVEVPPAPAAALAAAALEESASKRRKK